MQNDYAYTYYAFISYSHKDEKWAKWIQAALENYRLPAAVRKEAGKPLPPRIQPVFRDATDLGAGKLVDNLRQELDQSRFLIVVCSPNSAKPNAEGRHWVNEEVERFCELGRADHVIPVIVEGTAETSLCPKIREEGLLGLDATCHSKGRILNDLVAKILGLRPDELWRREERRLRARRRWRIGAATLAVSFAALGGYIAWDCTRTVTRAFADYVDSYGLPEGIFPLTAEQVSRRHVHYRFEFQGYRYGKSIHADSAVPSLLRAFGFHRVLRRVVQANSKNLPFESELRFELRPQILTFEYDDNQVLRKKIEACHAGDGVNPRIERIVLFADYRHGNVIDTNSVSWFEHGYDSAPMLMPEAMGEDIRAPIAKHRFSRDKNGRVKTLLFQDAMGNTICNSQGVAGIQYDYDEHGRVSSIHHLDRRGKPTKDRSGIAGEEWFWQGADNAGKRYYDLDFNTISGPDGWAISKWTNRVSVSGTEVEISYYDELHNRIPNRNGISSEGWLLDRHGIAQRAQFFDEDGNISVRADGVAQMVFKHDMFGRLSAISFQNEEGNATARSDGAFGVRFSYDRHWNVTNTVFIGENGKPCVISAGMSGYNDKYDDYGNLVCRRFFDSTGQICRTRSQDGGVAGWRRWFDSQNNPTNSVFLDESGHATPHADGNAGWSSIYHNGYRTSTTYFDQNGEVCRLGEHRYIRDDRGRIIEESYRNKEGGLSGFYNPARIVYAYDDSGNVTNVWNYSFLGSPLIAYSSSITQTAQERREWSENGLLLSTTHLNKDGKRTINGVGICSVHFEYDKKGHQIGCRLFGTNGFSNSGWFNTTAGWTASYDRFGRQLCKTTIGTNGLPVIEKNSGFASVCASYDARGCATNVVYLDEKGNRARKKTRYGWMDGNAPIGREDQDRDWGGFSRVVKTWDSRGNLLADEYYGTNDVPVRNEMGVAKVRRKYDSRGNVTDVSFFDENDNPCASLHGVCSEHFDLDERGVVTNSVRINAGEEQLTSWDCWVVPEDISKADMDSFGICPGDIWVVMETSYDILSHLQRSVIELNMVKPEIAAQLTKPKIEWAHKMRDDEKGGKLRPFLHVIARRVDDKWGLHPFVARSWHANITGIRPILQADFISVTNAYSAWLTTADLSWTTNNLGGIGMSREEILVADVSPTGTRPKATRGRLERKYDISGQLVFERYIRQLSSDVTNSIGLQWQTWKYQDGRVSQNDQYGSIIAPALDGKDGLYHKTLRYNHQGQLTEELYFDKNNNPWEDSEKAVRRTFPDGKRWSAKKFDIHDREILPLKRRIEVVSPTTQTTWYHDPYTYEPCLGPEGTYGFTESKNEVGEITNILYLARNGAPCLSKYGYAECQTEYVAQYKPTRTAYYDTEGNLVTNHQGYAVQIETWDEHGKDTSVQWYDQNGNLIEKYPDEGAAYRLYEFYPPPWEYQESSLTYIGTNSLPVNNKKYGYARVEYDQTPDHKRIGRMYFLANGEPYVFPKGGHSGSVEFRDDHYNTTNCVYLGADGKPMLNKDQGFASYTTVYDYMSRTTKNNLREMKGGSDYGPDELRIAGQSYFGPDGCPIAKKTGEAGWRDKFDDYGRQIERTYFGTNGLPVMTKYGFATRQMFYDETTGAETNRVLRDANGEVIQPKEKKGKK